MEIKTDTGKHVLIEIWHGGKYQKAQAWRCLKCDAVFDQPWTHPPALQGCTRGDVFFDRGILHRSPARQADPKVFLPEVTMFSDLKPPMYLLTVSDNAGFAPVLFHQVNPGFVLVRDAKECRRVLNLLSWIGWEPPPGYEPAVVPINSEADFKKLPDLAKRCEKTVNGIYWNVSREPRGVGYKFMPFGSNA